LLELFFLEPDNRARDAQTHSLLCLSLRMYKHVRVRVLKHPMPLYSKTLPHCDARHT